MSGPASSALPISTPMLLGDRLHELECVVRSGTLVDAARELGLSESALSRHLASLEKDLGVKLVTRGLAGVRLTDEGRFAYDAACEVTRAGERLRASLGASSAVVVSPSSSAHFAGSLTARGTTSGVEAKRHLHVCGLEESARVQRIVRDLQE